MDERTARKRTFLLHNMRWFWPIADNDDDPQRLAVIGYFVCSSIALYNFVLGIFLYMSARSRSEHSLTVLVEVGVVLFFSLGSYGVRMRSVAAAAMMVALEMVSVVEERIADGRMPIDSCLVVILMLIVWRGIYLAARWEKVHGVAVSEPLYYNWAFGPSAMDGWAREIWTRFRVVFWILGVLLIGQNLVYFYLAYQDPSVR